MASDSSPPDEGKMRRKRREREVRRKVPAVPEVPEVQADIEDLTARGHLALQSGRREEALSCFKKALKASVELQDSRVRRACSFNLGAAYVEAGKPQKGLDFLQRAQPGPRADRVADLQFNLAVAHNALGQRQEAAAYFLQAAQLYRSQGDGASEGDACMEMARCYVKLQDWTQAVQGFLRAGESYRVAAVLDSAAIALKEAGSHMVQSDQFSQDDITSVLTECLNLADSITDPRTLGELYLAVGVAYCRLRCFWEAVRCFQQALPPSGPPPTGPPPPSLPPTLLADTLLNLGAALNSVGQFRPAVGYHRLAVGLYGSLGRRADQAQCFSNLAFACSQLGEEEEAEESFIHALQAFRDTEDYPSQCQVCEALADSYLKQKKIQKAAELYKQALSALSRCPDGSSAVQDRLVERLTAALQQRLSVSLQRPRPLRPRPLRPHPDSPPSGQPGSRMEAGLTKAPADAGGSGGKGPECR
ncbi:tetratricopeptide repeat protein 24 [Centroberyx gerrardi]